MLTTKAKVDFFKESSIRSRNLRRNKIYGFKLDQKLLPRIYPEIVKSLEIFDFRAKNSAVSVSTA